MTRAQYKVIALDLEGTLISNAMSQWTRPGLMEFLEFCRDSFERVVLYTTISDERVRRLGHVLVEEGSVPKWFADIECISWNRVSEGETQAKDLKHIPEAEVEECLIVDDIEEYILPDQKSQWIPIKTWGSDERFELHRSGEAYPSDDKELHRVISVLEEMLNCKP